MDYPRSPDFIDRLRSLEEQVRRLRTRKKPVAAFVEWHTFLVGGEVYADLYVPPAIVAVDTAGDTGESKAWLSCRGKMRTGSVTVSMLHNEASVIAGWTVGTALSYREVSPDIDLEDGDLIRLAFTAGSGTDGSVSVAIRVSA